MNDNEGRMPMLPIKFLAEGQQFDADAWPDLNGEFVISEHAEVAILPGGMSSGLPAVCIRVDAMAPDGTPIAFLHQTSARLFVLAARAIEAKYPNLLD